MSQKGIRSIFVQVHAVVGLVGLQTGPAPTPIPITPMEFPRISKEDAQAFAGA